MIRKIVASLLVAIVIAAQAFTMTAQGINAQTIGTIRSKSSLNVDETLIVNANNYVLPESLLLAKIEIPAAVQVNDEDWYRGLFYYFSSERYLFKDIPLHYLVDNEGVIYQGIEGGVERELVVSESKDKPVVIAYLAPSESSDFTLAARETLESLILKVINENSIKPENIEFKDLVLKIDDDKNEAGLEAQKAFGSWEITFGEIQRAVSSSYKPQRKQYSVEVLDFQLPAGDVQIGSELVLKLKLRNTSENTIFAGSESELILKKKAAGASRFFLNGIWLSNTQIPVMGDGDVLLSGKENEYEVRVSTPTIPGAFSEEFSLQNGFGDEVNSEGIKISLNIGRGNLKLLEILPTETGVLNVRSQPTTNSEVLTAAVPGNTYVWTEERNGWYKIKAEGEEGWILGKYVKVK